MRASTRRSLAVFSAAALALAACGADDDSSPDDDAAAAPDASEEVDPEQLPDDLDPEAMEPPTFEEGDLEGDEVIPGVVLEVPEGGEVQAGPGPGGSVFQSLYADTGAVVFVEAAVAGLSVDELLQGLEGIEESGEAEITSEAEDVDVPGADEARRVSLVDVNERQATLVVATAGDAAVSMAIEADEGSDFDPEPIIASLELDGERIEEASPPPQQAPQQPAPQQPAPQQPAPQQPAPEQPQDPESDD